VADQVVGTDRCAVVEHDGGSDRFTPPLVADPEHRGGGHGRMGAQGVLHLFWVDVEPAADDQVLCPVERRK